MPPLLFGSKLRALRERYGLTLHATALVLQLDSHAHLVNIEAGRERPSLSLVLRVAYAFDVSCDELLLDAKPLPEQLAATPRSLPHDDLRPQRLGEKLRTLRTRTGVSQAHVAAQLGIVSRAYLANLEAGRKTHPSPEVIVALATFYQVSIDVLLQDALDVPPRTTTASNIPPSSGG
jgi:transcriptional regulator with XRE-family HTH domain